MIHNYTFLRVLQLGQVLKQYQVLKLRHWCYTEVPQKVPHQG